MFGWGLRWDHISVFAIPLRGSPEKHLGSNKAELALTPSLREVPKTERRSVPLTDALDCGLDDRARHFACLPVVVALGRPAG
jgi:hypothetical protein